MFKTILIPLDLTDKHDRVLQCAAELAQASDGRVILVHVVEMIDGIQPDEERDFFGRLEKSAELHLERHAQMFQDQQIPVERRVLFGRRVRDVAKFAADVNADLILVTAPRLDPDQPAGGFASLSWKIALLASCPVLLVK